jgi:hypothetical protein
MIMSEEYIMFILAAVMGFIQILVVIALIF